MLMLGNSWWLRLQEARALVGGRASPVPPTLSRYAIRPQENLAYELSNSWNSK